MKIKYSFLFIVFAFYAFFCALPAYCAEDSSVTAKQRIKKGEKKFIPLNQDVYKGGKKQIVIRPYFFSGTFQDDLSYAAQLHYFDYAKRHPEVQIKPYTRMRISGNEMGSASLWMAMAAENSPDEVWLRAHSLRQYVTQNLLYPLDEYVGRDIDGDGFVSNDEAFWEGWKMIPDDMKRAVTVKGHVYAIPQGIHPEIFVLLYRRDIFEKNGLDPNRGPKDWKEFYEYCKKLTDPKRLVPGARYQMGTRGFYLQTNSWDWYPWFFGAGGDLVRQYKFCPRCKKMHGWPKEDITYLCPKDGKPVVFDEKGKLIPTKWRATFADDPAGRISLEFIQKLMFAKFIKRPDGTGIDVTEEDIKNGKVKDPKTDKYVYFTNDDVIKGVTRIAGFEEGSSSMKQFRTGEVAMMIINHEFIPWVDLSPSQIGIAPIPPMKEGMKPYTMYTVSYYAIASPAVAPNLRYKPARDVVFDLISSRFSYDMKRANYLVEHGLYRYLPPSLLKQAGLTKYLDALPKWWIRNYNNATKYIRAEPFEENATIIQHQVLKNNVFSLITIDPDIKPQELLEKSQEIANDKHLSGRIDPKIKKYRPLAWAFVAVIFALTIIFLWTYIRSSQKKFSKISAGDAVASMSKYRFLAPLLLLLPAISLVVLWKYVPLFRGSLMAFMDFKIVGESVWVGVDNFLKALFDPLFWQVVGNTIVYVGLALGMGFAAPIILALLLNEVPIGKYLFRTIFYLPNIMSGLVIMLLWKMFYAPSAHGLLNRLLLTLNSLPLPLALLLKWGFIAVCGLIIYLVTAAVAGWKKRDSFSNMVIFGFVLVVWGITAAIFWRFYTETGSVFTLLKDFGGFTVSKFDFKPQRWLLDPHMAMACVILPGVWGGMGSASLIYLAALKSIPEDLYEAADIDGAGMRAKLIHVTLPVIKPLIVINFVGATIGAFHAMGNILVMTGGGPANATMTTGLFIWYQAFSYLNFGYATAMAWIMGTMLIGFTVFQLRILREVEFRRAEEN